MTRLKQRGDTIVEVLLALLVISSVLVGAYTTSNRSLQNSRQAQERGEVLKIIEAQVEQIKTLAEDPGKSDKVLNNSDFCIVTTATGPDTVAYTDPSCKVGTIPGRVSLRITRNVAVFNVQATWANAIGKGNDRLAILYKHNR